VLIGASALIKINARWLLFLVYSSSRRHVMEAVTVDAGVLRKLARLFNQIEDELISNHPDAPARNEFEINRAQRIRSILAKGWQALGYSPPSSPGIGFTKPDWAEP
jgi:hypothetical protein